MMSSDLECVLRLIIALICGAAVGLEREKKNQAAGLRTHIAVILGATLVMLLSKYGFSDIDFTARDPGRMASQVVSGIGFLGAGTIIVNRNKVRGLTTAASLWTTACIGLAVGAGFYVPAITTTILLVGTLSFLQYFEHKYVKRGYKKFHAVVEDVDVFMDRLETLLGKNGIVLEKVKIKNEAAGGEYGNVDLVGLDIFLQLPAYADTSFLVGDLSQLRGVRRVEEIK
ncbi:MAG: MgtC/SapB family protein [Bacillota bacterium]|nr:MgtC/SapB family protein [Bacillota bacterium]